MTANDRSEGDACHETSSIPAMLLTFLPTKMKILKLNFFLSLLFHFFFQRGGGGGETRRFFPFFSALPRATTLVLHNSPTAPSPAIMAAGPVRQRELWACRGGESGVGTFWAILFSIGEKTRTPCKGGSQSFWGASPPRQAAVPHGCAQAHSTSKLPHFGSSFFLIRGRRPRRQA